MANQSLTAWLNNDAIKKKLVDRLGKNAEVFRSTLINIYNSNPQLQNCDGRSILGAAFFATSLNLSIAPGLAQAYIVPFKVYDKDLRKDIYKATFQIGTKGYLQLALRTGQYARINASKVCEGEIRGFNPITGEPVLGDKLSNEIIGYVAYMQLINGFEKTLYMTKPEIQAYAEKYSPSYNYDRRNGKNSSPWSTNFDEMATKTVLKKLLRSWGILSSDLVSALRGDQSIVDKNTFSYPDNGNVQSREEIYLPDEQHSVNEEIDTVVRR